MFDRGRLIALAVAAGAGLGAGAAAWLVWAAAAAPDPAGELSARVAALSVPVAAGRASVSTADILSMALFPDAPTDAPVAAAEASTQAVAGALRLHGLSITPRRRAALISAAGGPAMWIPEGQEVGGMVLRRVRRDGVAVELAGAQQVLRLHQETPAAPDTAQPPIVETTVPSAPAVTAPPSGETAN